LGPLERRRLFWLDCLAGIELLGGPFQNWARGAVSTRYEYEQTADLFRLYLLCWHAVLSTALFPYDVVSNTRFTTGTIVVETLQLSKLRSLKSHGGVDRALLSFDLTVDLEPAFHWNIKQLFVYVVAAYDTVDGRTNRVVLWDKIVEATDPKVIQEENVFVKYALVDKGDELRGKDVTLQLQWDHMPITGLLYRNEQNVEQASTFQLPTEYQ